MHPSNTTDSGTHIAHAFRDAVEAALLEASTLEWRVSLGAASVTEKPELSAAAGFRFSFSGATVGYVLVGVDHDMLPRLALRDLTDGTHDAANGQKSRLQSAFEGQRGLLENAVSKAGAASLQIELQDGPALGHERVFELVCQPTSGGKDSGLSIYVCVSSELISDLDPTMAKAFVFPQAAGPGTNLDLVMDVELKVTLRFGQRQLALREVLELASGSVVELDRQVDEPIELILDGKVVARGEAVIIDGNYGMRVTQVVQPLLA